MPTASFARDIRLTAGQQAVWDTITDVPRLVEWVSILHDATEVERLARYRAVLQDRLGPFRLKAELAIAVPEVEEGRRIVVTAEGEDRQVSSRISVRAEVVIEEEEQGAVLRVEGSYEVAGKVATMGASMIRSKADKILDEFFGRLERELG